jgi:23S rRNA pseudouridine1911/1915/1917 synthase
MNRVLSHRILPQEQGRRLDRVLAEVWPTLSRSRIQALLKAGWITVDGQPARASEPARTEALVEARLPAPEATHLIAEAIPLSVVFEDEHILVVDKPAGLVVHPGSGVRSGTLVNALLAHCPNVAGVGGVARPGLVHRLDRDTTGLLVVAKDEAAWQGLTRALRERRIHRRYLALTWGVPHPREGRIETSIGRDPRDRKRQAVRPPGAVGARPAATRYRVIEELPATSARARFALVRCELETGRTHQIRVHLSHLGTPVVGDETYGGGAKKALSLQGEDRRLAQHLAAGLGRQALHASDLQFDHPIHGGTLNFRAPLPDDMGRALTLLGSSVRP